MNCYFKVVTYTHNIDTYGACVKWLSRWVFIHGSNDKLLRFQATLRLFTIKQMHSWVNKGDVECGCDGDAGSTDKITNACIIRKCNNLYCVINILQRFAWAHLSVSVRAVKRYFLLPYHYVERLNAKIDNLCINTKYNQYWLCFEHAESCYCSMRWESKRQYRWVRLWR